MRNAPFPAAVNLIPPERDAENRSHFQSALRGSLLRRGYRRIAFERDGAELLAVASRDGCIFCAVYDMPTGRVLLQGSWAAGEAGRELFST